MVKCKLCSEEFFVITYSHLNKHSITIEEYRYKFGDESITSNELSELKKEIHKPGYVSPILQRNCPECGKEVNYSSMKTLTRAIRQNRLCNSCRVTGNRNPMNNEVFRKKVSEAKKGWIPSKKTRDKMSKNHSDVSGKNNPMYGKKRSREEIAKIIETKLGVPYDEYLRKLPLRERYTKEVRKITKQQPIRLIENYDKRGMTGKDGAYHLDHIIPISFGFNNDILPEKIGNINNLQFIPWLENIKKNNKVDGRK